MQSLNVRDFLLKQVEKPCGVCSIHLGVVKLELYREGCLESVAAVCAPYHEGIVEATIHSYCIVYDVFSQRRCADYHVVGDVTDRLSLF